MNYFQGVCMKYCKNCNCNTEIFNSGRCKPCTKIRCAKYNKDNAEKISLFRKKKYAENPDPARIRAKKWAEKNYERKTETNKKWHEANPESHKKSVEKYSKNNSWVNDIRNQRRRARKALVGGTLTKGLRDKLYKLQRGLCACGCKKKLEDKYHLDHIMPLALGGSNEDWNIQLLSPECNKQKHAKNPIDFMQQRGFLI